ncbi:MAG: hypothetical protein UX09_C0043G0002 [Candidatus Uhrbacteria bacterium GW2011_GWE2_45_35]|uniref:GGDEF domain-containing protein n=2 Tax=Candidatus Uhriibacteriota TaxID=1752732 RepID=A0A0G1JEB1_9BACT|nr:MAG: hypothetical protein UW63_C0040G0002 [Candidatus Uhrbacteria bacterium GW2011_GWF2_44_350]KKU06735.1 MAG: hypothetical protein UX09_C0043G0002 [Candidatus Uhrbacteria bacterium GW2011_GWE2_45_35]
MADEETIAQLLVSKTELERRIAELEAENVRLREFALRDPLTGAHNRRVFDEMMEREMALARRNLGYNRGLLIVDIDDFKRINDSFGHPVGDFVLCLLVDAIRVCVRTTDFVCRIGGDEFAIILSDPIDICGVLKVGDRIVKALVARPVKLDESRRPYVTFFGDSSAVFSLTLSIGGSIAKPGELSVDFFRRVDDILMEQAKPAKKPGASTIVCV